MIGLLVGFALAVNGLNVVNSYVGRDFMTAIVNRDQGEFVRQAVLYVAVFAALTVMAILYRFVEERFGVFWRVWLTRRVVRGYMADRTYYRLKEQGGVGNPDQRIADDVRTFTATTLSFTLMFMNGTLAALSFSGVLWTISPLLFGVAVGYAVLGTLSAIYLGKPLVGLNYRQSDLEAEFSGRPDSRPRECGAGRAAAPRRTADGPVAPPARRSGRQLPADHDGQPQPRLFHHRLQLPDPDHPGPDRRPAVHPRRGRVRRHHAVGDGVRPAPRGLLVNHQPVPINLVVYGGGRPARGAVPGRRANTCVRPGGDRRCRGRRPIGLRKG